MSRKCVICGRELKTGRKYCHVCRSIQTAKDRYHSKKKEIDVIWLWVISLTGIFYFGYSLFIEISWVKFLGWIGLGVGILILWVIGLRQGAKKKKLEER